MGAFKDKVVLITGASSGIGRATALAFGREGARVVVASRRTAEGQETARLVDAAGGEGLFVKTDVASEADVYALVQTTIEAFGRLDCAFNNAGVLQNTGSFTDCTMEEFDRVMGINVKGLWLCMKQEIAAMLHSGGGAIVNMSSVVGEVAFPGAPVYTASKHAVIGLTKAAALEYAKSGIRVNAVAPAVIATDMTGQLAQKDPKFNFWVLATHPIGRAGKPEEVSGAVLWLCSENASFVTGHTLIIDGGYSAQ
jgi:NAD(P)-dependent dehydrogenase (short-subunit alcohol dehydrogenase family)